LLQTVAAHGKESADRLAGIIVGEVETWRGVRSAPGDNVTLVAVKRLG
jgi:hypothetical protein